MWSLLRLADRKGPCVNVRPHGLCAFPSSPQSRLIRFFSCKGFVFVYLRRIALLPSRHLEIVKIQIFTRGRPTAPYPSKLSLSCPAPIVDRGLLSSAFMVLNVLLAFIRQDSVRPLILQKDQCPPSILAVRCKYPRSLSLRSRAFTKPPCSFLQRIGTALFGPKGIPTTISQVAFKAEAGAIDAIVKAFPANGNAVGTAATGCGPDVKYTGY
jgi:hypothetical protein